MTRQEFAARLNLEQNFIPTDRRNRPGTANVPRFITIHNTDNTSAGADARAHARFLINTGHYMLKGKKHWVSWHYTVDDRRVVKHLPINEKALHAASANTQSIAIEVCMNQGIDQERAFLNAARLAALLLFDLSDLNRDVNKVVPHHFWTGKNCPRLLLNNGSVGSKWNGFLGMVQQELDSISEPESGVRGMMEDSFDEVFETNEAISPEVSSDFHLDMNEDGQDEGSCVPVDAELYTLIGQEAQKRGISTETLVNLWLQQKASEQSGD